MGSPAPCPATKRPPRAASGERPPEAAPGAGGSVLEGKPPSREDEALRTAALLDAVAREAERLGERQEDPVLRRALLGQVARARADAAHLRNVIGQRS